MGTPEHPAALARHQLVFAFAVGALGASLLGVGLPPGGSFASRALAIAALAALLATLQALFGAGLARALGLEDLGHGLCAGLLLALCGLDRAHYAFFAVPLDADTLGVALDALRAREIVIPPRWIAAALAGLALLAAFLAAGLATLRRTVPTAAVGGRALAGLVALGVAAGALTLRPPDDAFGASLRALLPWLEPAVSHAHYTVRGKDGDPLRLDASEMDRQMQALARARDSLLSTAASARHDDIVLIVLESFRWDLVTPEATPFLSQLGAQCLHPERHYATGANTLSGLFGLLHGLSMFHFAAVKQSIQQPLPLALLERLGYERRLFRGFDLAYAELGERFFTHSFDVDVAELRGDAAESDAALVKRFLAMRRGGHGPRFDLLVLYSTHWPYLYPPEFERFRPVAPPDIAIGNAGQDSPLRAWAEGLHNRQRNAAAYLDSLLEPMLGSLFAEPEPPLVVVTGDHGEEFFEHGRLGHTWDVNDSMVRVPLWICLEEPTATRYRHSDHSDVFPTLFDVLGFEPPPERYMTGKSLLRYDAARDFALTGVPRRRALLRMAVVGDGLKVHFRPFGVLAPIAIDGSDDARLDAAPVADVQRLLERAAGVRERLGRSGWR